MVKNWLVGCLWVCLLRLDGDDECGMIRVGYDVEIEEEEGRGGEDEVRPQGVVESVGGCSKILPTLFSEEGDQGPRIAGCGTWSEEHGARSTRRAARSRPNASRGVHEPIQVAQLCLGVPVGLDWQSCFCCFWRGAWRS